MVFAKNDMVIISQKGKGRFLAKVLKDFETEKDRVAEASPITGGTHTYQIDTCKFKLATKEQVDGIS